MVITAAPTLASAPPLTPAKGPTYGPVCHDYGIRGYGDPSYGVVLVGIAPGRDETIKTHRPFTGASGQLLDKLLAFAGWSRERVYTTNALCWFNNTPNPDQLSDCAPRFWHELTWAKPKLIVTLGAIANEAVTGAKRRKGSRGAVTWSEQWKAYVLDTHHPSAVLQGQSMGFAQDIIRDLEKIPRVLEWEPRGHPSFVSYNVVSSLSEAQAVLDTLPTDGRPVTLDIETSNPDDADIDAFVDGLLCFSISYHNDNGQETTTVFPSSILPGCVRDGTHERGTCVGTCQVNHNDHILRFPTNIRWAFHSGDGDINGIRAAFGQRLPLRDDTMLMSVCNDERPGYHKLKTLAREYFCAGWYEEQVKPFYKNKMHLLPPDALNEYNAKDSAYDLRLVPVLSKGMADCGTNKLYEDLLKPASDTFIEMQWRGINVDQSRLRVLAYTAWFPRYLEMTADLQREAHSLGWPTDKLNLNSDKQLQQFFFDVLKLEPIKHSKKTGRPSLDKETLDQLDHPFADKLRAFRQLDGIIDYVYAIFDHLKYDGLLHPQGNVGTTRTGRTSYRNPAMQTLPKDYTVGADYARLREIIIPHNPDTHGILEADFEQIEVWMAQHHSQDPVLLEHLLTGDVHSATAEGAFDVSRHDFSPLDWSEYRQNAKKIRFGLQYGESAVGLARPRPVGMGCSVGKAQRFIDNFWRTYPVHYKWTLSIQEQILELGFLRSASGRVMRFPIVLDHKQLRQAINFPGQADASDTNLFSMIELAAPPHLWDRYPAARELSKLNSWVILNIHDNLTIEYDLRYRDEVIALVKRVMERPKFPGYPSIKVDVKAGPNLGAVAKIK